jgi:hypothetical protein
MNKDAVCAGAAADALLALLLTLERMGTVARDRGSGSSSSCRVCNDAGAAVGREEEAAFSGVCADAFTAS